MAKPKPLKVNKAKATKTSNGKKNNKPAKKAAVKGAEVLMLATEANDAEKKPLGLLDLPPEIWSKICKLAVTSDHPVLLKPGLPDVVVRQPGITRVCRRVREECLPDFYRVNEFKCIPHVYPDEFQGSVGVGFVGRLNGLLDVAGCGLRSWRERVGKVETEMTRAEVVFALRSELNMTTDRGDWALSWRARKVLERGLLHWSQEGHGGIRKR